MAYLKQPKTVEAVGVDTGIIDAFHTSDNRIFGSMKPVLDFYHEEVETAFGELNSIRNKKRSIRHYLHAHPVLPESVRCSLIRKMDRLEHMIQTMDAPYRKERRYYGILDEAIYKSAISETFSHDTLTVVEKLDIKEFKKSRHTNAMFSTFARGRLQKHLMDELNWRGYDFMEVIPDYTSQVCPICGNLDEKNRNSKVFRCTCCGHEDDADYIVSQNIRNRAADKEILETYEKHKYKKLQEELRSLYTDRNKNYKNKQNLQESTETHSA